MSGEYQRLQAVNDLSTDAYGAEDLCTSIEKSITDCEQALSDFRASSGVTGELDEAINTWIEGFSKKLSTCRSEFTANVAQEQAARSAMAGARASFGTLMTDELIDQEAEYWRSTDQVHVSGMTVTGTAYAAQLRQQRITERDIKAKEILQTMESRVEECRAAVTWGGHKTYPANTPDAGSGSSYAGTRSTGFSSVVDRGAVVSSAAANTAVLGASTVGGAVLSTRTLSALSDGVAVNWRRPAPGAPGSASNPISDYRQISHIDLLRTPINQRMSADGPVGGHVPPPTDNIDDPSWRSASRYYASLASSSARQNTASLGLVGGVLGVGGSALTAQNLRGGASSPFPVSAPQAPVSAPGVGSNGLLSAQTAGGTGAGTASLLRSDAALSNTGPGTAMGAAARQGHVLSASNAGAGLAQNGALGAQGARGAAGMMPNSARRGSDSRRERRSRRGYDIIRIEEDQLAPPSDPVSFQAGDAASLAPMTTEESDQW